MSNEVFKDLNARIKTFNKDYKKSSKKDYSKKSNNEMTVKFRDSVAEMFVQCISDDAKREQWHRGWGVSFEAPINAASQTAYRGINKLFLMLVMLSNGWTDNRFITMSQANKQGYKVKKGSKSFKVEYWFPFDYTNNKSLTWEEFRVLEQSSMVSDSNVKFGLKAKYFNVFHASQIDGIPQLEPVTKNDIHHDEIIEKISSGMSVKIQNDGGDKAYYSSTTDDIHLPKTFSFLSDYDYAATALHELAHASGAENRLNRDSLKDYNSSEAVRAFEELIAEITSCFMSANLGIPQETRDYGTHRAYVQSWIKAIKDDARHKVLFDAIKEAEKASDYMQSFLKKEVEQNGQ